MRHGLTVQLINVLGSCVSVLAWLDLDIDVLERLQSRILRRDRDMAHRHGHHIMAYTDADASPSHSYDKAVDTDMGEAEVLHIKKPYERDGISAKNIAPARTEASCACGCIYRGTSQ